MIIVSDAFLGEWLHLVPWWHPGSHLIPWWLRPGGISQRTETLVLRDQPGKPDYLWYLDSWWPAGNAHHHTNFCRTQHFCLAPCKPFIANRCRSFRFSFATFRMWTCHSQSRDGPLGRSSVSDSKHPLSLMCCGFVRLCFCFHAVKLSGQVGHDQTFSLYMCLCSSLLSHLCLPLSCFPCDMHFSWLSLLSIC